jgi:hypothetical protein
MSAPIKIMKSPPAAILPKKTEYQRNTSKRLPDDIQPANKLGDFPDPHLFKCSFDSYTVKPAKEFLHSIRKNNYSSDSPDESAGIICVCLKELGTLPTSYPPESVT